jgi:hypothetical protein
MEPVETLILPEIGQTLREGNEIAMVELKVYVPGCTHPAPPTELSCPQNTEDHKGPNEGLPESIQSWNIWQPRCPAQSAP